ncbi:calcium-responsive transcription factor-like isoform X1 [Anguilla rostrata]|uniref:calcium-responsive transcription factor-like isoform X1 n=1 Tax=Anguilla rostrata TaxID=7938 RepID=UPI0030D2EB00
MEAQVWDGECVVTEGDALDSENNGASASPQDAQADIPECGAGEVAGGSSPAQVKLETQEPSVIVPVAVSGGGLQAQVKLETQEASQNSLLAQNAPLPDSRAQTEEFIIFDQNGQPLQYERMVILTGQSENGQLYVIPSNHFGGAQVLLPQGQLMDIGETAGPCVEKSSTEHAQTITLTAITDPASGSTVLTSPPVTQSKAEPQSSPDSCPAPPKPLPPNTPSWAHLLHSCEKIGDSYRGFCTNEAELEAVLMLHKQHTHSVFGTRQSPSPAKPATRLMWKSQYVPYDGIPFVNAGSRAIVMECQFGPRRKGLQPKKTPEQEISTRAQYKATCPARIYIKKVRKFPEYRVPTDPKVDKKVVRQEQEKAFFNLKKSLWDAGGVLRYYVQLPTQKAHLYHSMDTPVLPSLPAQLLLPKEEEPEEEEEEDEDEEGAGGEGGTAEDGSFVPSRLHPRVAEKIVELVAQGHSQVYAVRKQLRKFVEREMFKSDKVPERHNLCYFPTVNDIKNHIHEAQKQLQPGGAGFEPEGTDAQWAAGSESAFSETVTLTLAPATEATPQRGEALEGSDTLSHEAMQLFSSLTALQPKIFAQLHGVQFQPALCGSDRPPPPQRDLAPPPDAPGAAPPQPLLLSPAQFLQPAAPLGEGVSLSDPAPLLGVGQLVSVSALTDGSGEGGVHQILLDDGQAIPVQIVEPVTGAGVSVPEDQSEASELEVSGTDGLHSPKD